MRDMPTTPDIDDDLLGAVVAHFYERVRADEELGALFEGAVENWPAHLVTLTDFWSSVLLTSGRYKGNPMAAHQKHRDRITPALFDRWLALWAETTNECAPAPVAALMQAKAARIAESLKFALFFNPATRAPGRPVAPA